jgi:hypothetical protein
MELQSSPRKAKSSRGSVESSEDDGSEDVIGTRKFGKRWLGKGKASPQKKKAKATKKTRDEDSDDNGSYYDDKKDLTPIYNMNRRELIAKIKEQKKNVKGSQNETGESEGDGEA